MKKDEIRKKDRSGQEATTEYVAPQIVTYSGDRLLEEMGPARACGASVPACPISD